MVEIIEDSF